MIISDFLIGFGFGLSLVSLFAGSGLVLWGIKKIMMRLS